MMPVRRSQNWLPSIFNDFFDNDWVERTNVTAPAINVIETANNFKVEVAAPGMTKDDFNVRLDEDENLVISMEKKTENKEEKVIDISEVMVEDIMPKLKDYIKNIEEETK